MRHIMPPVANTKALEKNLEIKRPGLGLAGPECGEAVLLLITLGVTAPCGAMAPKRRRGNMAQPMP